MKIRNLAAAGALSATLLLTNAPIADAAWHQPYGGCKEAYQAPRSQGARECRQHGWLVKRWIVATPTGEMRYISGPAYARLDRGCIFLGKRWTVTMPNDLPIVRRINR